MSVHLPRVGSVVEITLEGPDAPTYRSRLEDVEGTRLSVSVPADPRLADASGLACAATVRWSAGPRGSARAPARLSFTSGARASLVIELTGPVELEQNRRFVRGGGFETIELRREHSSDPDTYTGWVADLSEASVCGRFPNLRVEVGESVWVQMDIDGTAVSGLGQVLKAGEGPVTGTTSVVVGYHLDEAHASAIRRYLLRHQALQRSRGRIW